MAPATSFRSKTLKSITLEKIRELSKQRTQHESRKEVGLAAAADPSLTQQKRIKILIDGVKDLLVDPHDLDDKGPELIKDNTLNEIWTRLDQSVWDASVPTALLDSHEALLRSKLDAQSRGLNAAELYSRLVMEWMDSDAAPPMEDLGVRDHAQAAAEAEERQKQHLDNLCNRFEKVVFTPLETDENAIASYLAELFTGDAAQAALTDMRNKLHRCVSDFLYDPSPFTESIVKMCVEGLSREDYISEEKQALLRDYVENNGVVLREIADVLNTRYANLENWQWDADVDEVIPVLPRQQLNGKYRIWIDEDLLQAILIHHVGVRCCVALKEALKVIVESTGDGLVWRWYAGPRRSREAIARWEYYVVRQLAGYQKYNEGSTVHKARRRNYLNHFFLAALPTKMEDPGAGEYDEAYDEAYDDYDYDKSVESDDDDAFECAFGASKDAHKNARQDARKDARDDWAMEDWDGEKPDESGDQREETGNKPINTQQFLLRILATETMLQRAMHGGAAVVQSDLKWFGAGVSHTTIFAIMRFFCFPEKLVGFFKKVLEAPLNLSTSSSEPRTRRRGIPMARSPGRMIGEMVLFIMDFAVNRETCLLLYRLHDDLWMTGRHEDTTKAWATMQRCAKVMGLELNEHKTGSVYLINDEACRDPAITAALPPGPFKIGHLGLDPASGKWVIDQERVAEHVAQLRKQLAECRSVLEWIRTWNSCISRFFGKAFAPCITSRKKIMERFGVNDPSDAFVLFPDELGGLGLMNPFSSFFTDVHHDGPPEAKVKKFIDSEPAEYESAKKAFDEDYTAEFRAMDIPNFKRSEVVKPEEMGVFFDIEEWKMHRETRSESQALAFTLLEKCVRKGETFWLIQMYRDEADEKFGGLRLVDKSSLPLGVLATMAKKPVRWGMVL
ncbi:hypothetical protein CSOJ01_11741 [Colletotrichum sojae]|uniref:Reverse transcriptase domain-containing protein n=1 Tax=Colletotrichum sojae TaxID=2175907 RepID=A0A8H6IXB2_9PEZI|nr:hypothetical protein CSOJ01_11741 [Colletotrichum sojae]